MTRYASDDCTLIRRGDTQTPITATVNGKPAPVHRNGIGEYFVGLEEPVACKCGRRSMLCDAEGRCPDCQKAPVLGLDRNGREVRRGDWIRCVCGKPDHCGHGLPARIHDIGGEVVAFEYKAFTVERPCGLMLHEPWCELVDEKAERCCTCNSGAGAHRADCAVVQALDEQLERKTQCAQRLHGIQCDLRSNHAGQLHGFNDRNAPRGRVEWAVEGEPELESWRQAMAVHEFSRWLARPTMEERFEAFKEKVAAALHRFSVFGVDAVTDMTADGFLMRLRVGESRCDMHCKDDVSWEMVEGFVSIAVASEADRIGREALKRK